MSTRQFNSQQITAINDPASHIILSACPGSGKTTVIVERVIRLLNEGVSPYEFLIITFTKKLAQQLNERLGKVLSDTVIRKMTICTSHSFGLHIIKDWGRIIGYNENLNIYDEVDVKGIITDIIQRFGYKISPEKVIKQIKSMLYTGDNAISNEIDAVYKEYLYQLKTFNAIDYDMILYTAIDLLKNFPEVLRYYQNRYKYLFYDDFQDINLLENELCKILNISNTFIVGDINQNIYSWRGTSPAFFFKYKESYPDCKELTLVVNYRNPPEICEKANNLISHNVLYSTNLKMVSSKDIKEASIIIISSATKEEAIECIAECIKKNSVPLREIAILVRTNKQVLDIEKQLKKHEIPVQAIRHNSFWLKPEIKDILAFMRVICNYKDDFSMRRILKMPFLNYSIQMRLKFEQQALMENKTLFEVVMSQKPQKLSDIYSSSNSSVLDIYRNILKSEYMRYLEKQNLSSKIETIRDMEKFILEFEEKSEDKSLKSFFETISLSSSVDSWDEYKEAISLMTIHCAKGLEWRIVFITDFNEGLIPLPCKNVEEMEEERRLFYVALTRAKEKVYLISLRFFPISRFHCEMLERRR